jgi:4TM region of DNA translocase FtsK/SpoIIIE
MAQVLRGPAPMAAAPAAVPKLDARYGVFARRAVGGVLLVLWTALAFSLLTWSVTDPSLTHAASGGVRNWLGPVGAIVSDLMVQILGLASIVAVLPPAYWALQLLGQGRLPHLKSKLVCAPLAVAGLALAWSSLPLIASWPLKHGYGGIVGDMAYGRLVGVLSMINGTRAGIAAGIFGLAVGLFGLQRSFGLTKAELRGVLASTDDAAVSGLRIFGRQVWPVQTTPVKMAGAVVAPTDVAPLAPFQGAQQMQGWPLPQHPLSQGFVQPQHRPMPVPGPRHYGAGHAMGHAPQQPMMPQMQPPIMQPMPVYAPPRQMVGRPAP